MRIAALAAFLAAGLLGAWPNPAAAHPLGNFTINHYAGLTLQPDAIAIRYVLDMAEIPAFSALDEADVDNDGLTTDAEREQYAEGLSRQIVDGLRLELDGRVVPLEVVEHRIEFPPGQGGLDTLRLTLELRADHPAAAADGRVEGTFSDETFSERLGWREIVVKSEQDARLVAASVPESSVSDELRTYPADGLESPLDVREASFTYELSDTSPAATPGSSTGRPGSGTPPVLGPGGDPFGSLLATDGTPLAALLAVMVAIGLGAAHAVSPGHGKTLVAAYLIGAQGSVRQAAWLGLVVAVTHTAGIFVLGATVLGASELIVPERVIELLSVVTAVIVTGLGVWLLVRAQASSGASASGHGHHEHGAHDHHEHDAHGRHISTGSMPSVAVIGLAGGLVPSASALIVLLVAVNQGRLGFGILLIAAFGIGMALVLGGIGAAVVLFRARLDARRDGWMRHRLVQRLSELLPLVSAIAVLAIGVVLSAQALRALF